MGKPALLHELSLGWGNPCTTPPPDIDTLPGLPRVRWALTLLDHTFEADAWTHAGEHKPGDGWARRIGVTRTTPPRTWTPEAKGRVRRANLRKRLDARIPLFAQELFDAELAARPGYFFPVED